jgi:hypothetical protein
LSGSRFSYGHTSVLITVAGTTTVVLAVAQVDFARDLTRRRQRDNITHARGDVESLSTGNANETEEDSAGVHFVRLMVDAGQLMRSRFDKEPFIPLEL